MVQLILLLLASLLLLLTPLPQVADLVGRTPWHAGAQSRLVRTPGQILSLTSHLSFSSPDHQRTPDSLGGSFIQSSSLCTASPLLPQPISPSSAPCSNARKLTRTNSFTKALARHQQEQEARLLEQESRRIEGPPSSPCRPDPMETSVNSSFRLQELPNSSMDLGVMNKTIDFETPTTRGQEVKSNQEHEEEEGHCYEPEPFLPSEPCTPPRLAWGEEEDSRGSLSSSPKPLASLLPPALALLASFQGDTSPVSSLSSLKPSPRKPLLELSTNLPSSTPSRSSKALSPTRPGQELEPRSLPSSPLRSQPSSPTLHSTSLPSSPLSTPLLSPSLPSSSSTLSNMRALRHHSGSTPERLRVGGDSFDSDLQLETSGDQEHDETKEASFKVPTPLAGPKKRKVSSCSSTSPFPSPSCSGLTDDLTDLVVIKRLRQEEEERLGEGGDEQGTSPDTPSEKPFISCVREQDDLCGGDEQRSRRSSSEEQDEGRSGMASGASSEEERSSSNEKPSSSRSKGDDERRGRATSGSSEEEEQGPGYGYSTPVLPPLSAVPRHMKVKACFWLHVCLEFFIVS